MLLSEDKARTIRLDDLEATLVAAAIQDERLAALFHRLPTQVATPASCRAPTSRAPWSRIASLAGFAVESIRRHLDDESASIVVARWRDGDGIDVIRVPVSAYEQRTLGEWSVRISGQVLIDLKDRRAKALPSETGGVLIGATDSWNRVVHITAHESEFGDSEGIPVSFQRGLSGLPDRLKVISQRTHGALAYIGEWHSHPAGATARPSGDDIAQLTDVALALLVEDRPAISVIVAEKDHVLVDRLKPA